MKNGSRIFTPNMGAPFSTNRRTEGLATAAKVTNRTM
jgi:hypothetical protein